jgi:LacI family transcriptional regulator
VDGIMLVHWDRPPREQLQRLSVPVVCLDRVIDGQLSVTTDNRLGGRLAARHLVAQGHRRIAILAGQPTDNNVRERLQGFMAVLSEQPGIEKPQMLTGPEQAIELGYDVGRLLEGGGAPPTAIFSTNDIVAVGAWRSLLELGIRIPQDMSLIGYDDIEMTRLLIPPMTTVAQDKSAVARAATDLLMRVLDGDAEQQQEERRVIRVPPRLVVRGSTAPPSEVPLAGPGPRREGRKRTKKGAVAA